MNRCRIRASSPIELGYAGVLANLDYMMNGVQIIAGIALQHTHVELQTCGHLKCTSSAS
jgi:hypothetical protein